MKVAVLTLRTSIPFEIWKPDALLHSRLHRRAARSANIVERDERITFAIQIFSDITANGAWRKKYWRRKCFVPHFVRHVTDVSLPRGKPSDVALRCISCRTKSRGRRARSFVRPSGPSEWLRNCQIILPPYRAMRSLEGIRFATTRPWVIAWLSTGTCVEYGMNPRAIIAAGGQTAALS